MKCPGQDTRFWGKDAVSEVTCPHCGNVVEFFKDEPSRKCKSCGKKLINPKMDFGCATYCKFAKECLGELPEELIAKRESLIKDKVAIEVKKSLGRDFKAIKRMLRTSRYTEEIFKRERRESPAVIVASYLYYLPEEERKTLLERLSPNEAFATEVAKLLEEIQNPDKGLSPDGEILFDALALSNLEEKVSEHSEIPQFFTDSAKELAKEIQRSC